MATKRSPKMIGFIHKAIKTLGLQEEEYRAIYLSCTGKDSISGETDGQKTGPGMDNKELFRVIRALKELAQKGGITLEEPKKHKGVTLCQSPQGKKIRNLWLTLHGLGEVRNPSEKSLLAYVKKFTGAERMEWADSGQLSYVIEIMKGWLARVEDRQAEEAMAGSAGRSPEQSRENAISAAQ